MLLPLNCNRSVFFFYRNDFYLFISIFTSQHLSSACRCSCFHFLQFLFSPCNYFNYKTFRTASQSISLPTISLYNNFITGSLNLSSKTNAFILTNPSSSAILYLQLNYCTHVTDSIRHGGFPGRPASFGYCHVFYFFQIVFIWKKRPGSSAYL